MPLAIVLQSFLLFITAHSIPVDNGVEGEPEIECGSTAITVNFNTRNPFEGHVYVKPRFLTKVDRAYRVSCFYMETSNDVGSRLDVAELTTASVTGVVQMPVCRYDILEGGVHGNPLKFGKIGQQVYHRWSCISQNTNTFCMVVHSCTVDDGKGDRVNILDADGCATDRYVLNNIEYPDDLLAGQEAHVYKYADRDSLFYQCQISIEIKERGVTKECRRPACPDLLSTSPVRVFTRPRQGLSVSIHNSGSFSVSTPHPTLEPVSIYEQEYQRRHPVFGPAPAYKVDGSPTAESRLLRKRRSKSSTGNNQLTVDVRAEMTALDIEEGSTRLVPRQPPGTSFPAQAFYPPLWSLPPVTPTPRGSDAYAAQWCFKGHNHDMTNYTTLTSSIKQVCLTHQILAISVSFVLIIICSLLSMSAVLAMRLSSAY